MLPELEGTAKNKKKSVSSCRTSERLTAGERYWVQNLWVFFFLQFLSGIFFAPIITGPLFYPATIISHFPPLLVLACGLFDEWDTVIRKTNRQEVATNICHNKTTTLYLASYAAELQEVFSLPEILFGNAACFRTPTVKQKVLKIKCVGKYLDL